MADYVGGKMDWLAHDLAYEGEADLVGRHLRAVPTCTPDERVAEAAGRLSDASPCVVVAADMLVVGVLDEHVLAHHGDRLVGDVVTFGPTTIRPSEECRAVAERMAARNVHRLLVTDPAGRLLGVYEPDA